MVQKMKDQKSMFSKEKSELQPQGSVTGNSNGRMKKTLASQALFVLFAVIFLGIIGIGFFNYYVDAQCTFSCQSLNIERDSLNPFFQKAKQITRAQNLETLIVGSSRGESTSPLWYSDAGFGSTLNVSVAGSEALAKATMIDLALESGSLKRVIWLADDFDLPGQVVDAKIENLKALEKFFPKKFLHQQKSEWQKSLSHLQYLIDHKSFEAALKFLTQKDKVRSLVLKKVGEEFSLESCESGGSSSEKEEQLLEKNIQLIFQNYVKGPLRYQTPEENWNWFRLKLEEWNQKGIKIYLVMNPFHYQFLSRLKRDYADLFERHQNWSQRMRDLQGPQVKVISVDELESKDSPQNSLYWSDGVHYTCRIATKIFRKIQKIETPKPENP